MVYLFFSSSPSSSSLSLTVIPDHDRHRVFLFQEYQSKLEKVTAVKRELQSHLENLPDLSKLPNPVPLPSAGDLFSSQGRR